jgi:4-hydroxy-tetrahydrodipicolinate reductase
MLVRAVSEASEAVLVHAVERPDSEYIGQDVGELAGIGSLGVAIAGALPEQADADVLIDFTSPEACLANMRYAASKGLGIVVGTTGFTADQLRELKKIMHGAPVVMASNYSIGVNVALQLIRQAAGALDNDYDAEIIEAHHRHKVDAPSGTALSMGHAMAEGRGISFDDAAVYAREGITGERGRGDIGFSVVRAGDIVGEHTAMFAGLGERLEIRHVATDRMTFARGAVRAAEWLMGKPAGVYDMRDVLGLN